MGEMIKRREVRFGWTLLVLFLVPGIAFAGPKGRGEGKARGQTDSAEKVAGEVGKETVDAVADELLKENATQTGRPPGLSKKDKMPPGLEKQGKTPPGWEKGRKEGWNDSKGAAGAKKESGLRRMIRGILRKPQQPTQQQ